MPTNSLEYQRQWRSRHRAQVREYHKKWRDMNGDKIKEMNTRYRAKVAADPVKKARVKMLRHARYERSLLAVLLAASVAPRRPPVQLRSRGELVDYAKL